MNHCGMDLFGRISRKEEIKIVSSGNKGGLHILEFSVAINHDEEKVSFIPCVIYGNYASIMDPILKVGDEVFIKGEFELISNVANDRTYLNPLLKVDKAIKAGQISAGYRAKSKEEE